MPDLWARQAGPAGPCDTVRVTQLPGWTHTYSGKVRELYVPDETPEGRAIVDRHGDVVLVVASDRISAYDFVLSPGIPGKGVVLTQLTLWWFGQLADLVPNHLVSTDVPEAVAGRAMICRRLEMYPVECIARGYLTGSGLAEYQKTGEVTGIPLPEGLVDGSRLPETIFTPSTKAEQGEHDENVPFEGVVKLVGPQTAGTLRDLTLAVYTRAEQIACQLFALGRLQSPAEIVAHLDAIDAAQVRGYAARVMQCAVPAMAAVGPVSRLESHARFARRFGGA